MGLFRELFIYLWNLRFLPLRIRWPILKLRRRLTPRTGLNLRQTFHQAQFLQHPPQPNRILFILQLLWPPFPTTWGSPATSLTHPPPSLLSPRRIMANPDPVRLRGRDLIYLRTMPAWRLRDTPARAFHRLYEALCAADVHMITYETEYFWRRSLPAWAIAQIPDPIGQCCGDDEEQYVVLAALAEVLAEAFMWRLGLGMRRGDRPCMNYYKEPVLMVPEVAPSWAAKVPALKEKLFLHPDEDVYFDSPFHRRNIHVSTGRFYTV